MASRDTDRQTAANRATREDEGMNDILNLLSETTDVLAEHKRSTSDVRWVGNHNLWMSWDEFAAIADVTYDAGFGGANVNETLLIVGDDWWMERHEYDGSEWWEYKSLPIRPDCHSVPTTVLGYKSEEQMGDKYGYRDFVCPTPA